MATTRFNVVLDIPLSNAQKAAINKDIQAVVSKHVAKIDLGAIWGAKRIPKKEWLGIWLKRFRTSDALKNSITFNQFKVR